MQPTAIMIRRRSRLGGVLALALAASGLASATPALALDDGQEGLFTTLLSVTGLGGKKDEAPIEYRERAPLVLPPKGQAKQMPPPVDAAAQRPAAWPQDPDVARRAKLAKDGRAPLIANATDAHGRALSKDELLANRSVGGAPAGGAATTINSGNPWLNPDIIRSQNRARKDDSAALQVGVEPDRDYLTQPPPGYRKATKDVKVTLSNPNKDSEDTGQFSFLRKLNPFGSSDDD